MTLSIDLKTAKTQLIRMFLKNHILFKIKCKCKYCDYYAQYTDRCIPETSLDMNRNLILSEFKDKV